MSFMGKKGPFCYQMQLTPDKFSFSLDYDIFLQIVATSGILIEKAFDRILKMILKICDLRCE